MLPRTHAIESHAPLQPVCDRHFAGPMISPFRVEWRDEDEARSVWIFGEVDMASIDDLNKALACPHPKLVVDLSNVSFIDLTALRCLVTAAQEREDVVLITNPRVDRLLELTATRHLFDTR